MILQPQLDYISELCDDIDNFIKKQLTNKFPGEMNSKELDAFDRKVKAYAEQINTAVKITSAHAHQEAKGDLSKENAFKLKVIDLVSPRLARLLNIKKLINESRSTDVGDFVSNLLKETEETTYEELTLKVQLDKTPIYRTMKVIDRCSLFELNMLIQFLYNWYKMYPHAFKYQTSMGWMNVQPGTRLSSMSLNEGDKFQYRYDTEQDKWDHTITVLSVDEYKGEEDDYEPKCIAGYGPDPGERSGGNAYVSRNISSIIKKAKYNKYNADEINDSFHYWWTFERLTWIEKGIIKYDD